MGMGSKLQDAYGKIAAYMGITYPYLALIFLLLLLAKMAYAAPFSAEALKRYLYVIPLFAIPVLLKAAHEKKDALERCFPAAKVVLIFSFLLALGLRFLPYAHQDVPLGYDPGIYKYIMDRYASAIPSIPEYELPLWVRESHEQGLFLAYDALSILGVSTDAFFRLAFPLITAALVFPIFLLARMYFGERAAAIAALLYALSFTQYVAYGLLYLKTAFWLLFLLIGMYAAEKKRYVLLAASVGGLGIFHRPELALFTLALVPYILLKRDWKLVFACAAGAVLFLPFWIPRLDAYLSIANSAVDATVENLTSQVAIGTGTFIDFTAYQFVSLVYLPFMIIGMLYLLLRREFNLLFLAALLNGIWVFAQFFFFKRFIIPLDVFAVLLAACGAEATLMRNGAVGKAALALMLVVSAVFVYYALDSAKPLHSRAQISALEWIGANAEPAAFVLSTSYDAPWALGWSGRRVIAPGMFEWNLDDRQSWVEFLRSASAEDAREFLDKYNQTIYVYDSNNHGNAFNLRKFEGQCFQNLSRIGAGIYRYGC